MGSVGSIRPETQAYALTPGVQVRREDFGLLFYDSRGPRLTFVHSGPWLVPEFFNTPTTLEQWLVQGFPSLGQLELDHIRQTLCQALERLLEKGLLQEVL